MAMTFEQAIFVELMAGHITHPENSNRSINAAQIKAMAKNASDIAKVYEHSRPKLVVEDTRRVMDG